MPPTLLTEKDILDAAARGAKEIHAGKGTILTPSAKDAVVRLGIRLVADAPSAAPPPAPVVPASSYSGSDVSKVVIGKDLVVIGSDHGGFALKSLLKDYIGELGYRTLDIGTTSEEPCDYPDFAYAVARVVAKGEAWRGIMIDATGVASSIVCNKIPGVRAVACFNEFVAQSSREHNDANVLTIGAKAIGSETAKAVVKVWLGTWFGGGRHKRRVDKISDIERRYSK